MSREIEPTGRVGTQLLFENDRVRVWDLALAPGESLEKHIHHEDYLFIVVNGGSLRHVDPGNPANDQAVRYDDNQVVFLEANGGMVHNRLVNTGQNPYRNIIVELKKNDSAADPSGT